MYEVDPTDFNQNCWNETKEVLEFSIAKQQKVLLSAQELVRMNIEKETKYFLNLEKQNDVKKDIRKLLVSGVITTNPYKVLDEQKRFYHDLYKSRSIDMNCNTGATFLSSLNIP